MKQNTFSPECFESTYALLVRSEEKERGRFEGVAYLILVLSAAFSIWHLVQQPVDLSLGGMTHTSTEVPAMNTDRA